MHKSESMLKNEMHKILRNFEIEIKSPKLEPEV